MHILQSSQIASYISGRKYFPTFPPEFVSTNSCPSVVLGFYIYYHKYS